MRFLKGGGVCFGVFIVLCAGGLAVLGRGAGAGADVDGRARIHSPLGIAYRATIPAQRIDGLLVKGYSGLAWDEDDQVLYAVTDKGRIVHLALQQTAGKVSGLSITRVERLHAVSGQPLRKRDADAEGLAIINGDNGIKGDAELLIAIELPPRIFRYGTDGRYLDTLEVPGRLADRAAYKGASNGLESVAVHPRLGLMSAPEQPLARSGRRLHTIYTSSGKNLRLRRHDLGRGNIKAIEVLSDERILVLQRNRIAPGMRHVTSLRVIDPATCGGDIVCEADDISFSPKALPGTNFEGLAVLPGNRIALISDDEVDGRHQSELVILGPIDPTP